MKLKYALVILMLGCINTQTSLAENLFKQYKMPPLERVDNSSPIKPLLYQSKVLKRSQTVSIPLSAIDDPNTYQQQLRTEIQNSLPNWEVVETVVFTGNKVSELNSLLHSLTLTGSKKVTLQGQRIIGDEALSIPNNTLILGNNATLVTSTPQPSILISANNIELKDFIIETTGLGIQITQASGVILNNLQLTNSGRGIAILADSHFVEMNQIKITNPSQGGILIQGNVSHVWLHNSQVSNSKRTDNGGAGVLISDAKFKENLEESTKNSSLIEHIWPLKQPAPYALLIENNIFANNQAQGIFVDGGYGLVIQHNEISNNDKEGLCLSFGAVNNIVMGNNFHSNGFRTRQTDDDLRRDLAFEFGRLPDGSSVLKLPAIALDNAAQNLLLWNIIRNNAGDGIKIVRTGIRNIIMFNSIIDNNKGHNKYFHFFGVLLGSAGIEAKIDTTNHPIDFIPSIENIVAGNVIYGKHWAGIYLELGSAFNDIYDNMVHKYRLTPLDSTSTNFNSIVGNSWQIPTSPGSSWWNKLFD